MVLSVKALCGKRKGSERCVVESNSSQIFCLVYPRCIFKEYDYKLNSKKYIVAHRNKQQGCVTQNLL